MSDRSFETYQSISPKLFWKSLPPAPGPNGPKDLLQTFNDKHRAPDQMGLDKLFGHVSKYYTYVSPDLGKSGQATQQRLKQQEFMPLAFLYSELCGKKHEPKPQLMDHKPCGENKDLAHAFDGITDRTDVSSQFWRVFAKLDFGELKTLLEWLAHRQYLSPHSPDLKVSVTDLLRVYSRLDIKYHESAEGNRKPIPDHYTLPLARRQHLLKAITHTFLTYKNPQIDEITSRWKLGLLLHHNGESHGPFEPPPQRHQHQHQGQDPDHHHNTWTEMVNTIRKDQTIAELPHEIKLWLTSPHSCKWPRIEELRALQPEERHKLLAFLKREDWVEITSAGNFGVRDCLLLSEYERHMHEYVRKHQRPADIVKQWSLYIIAIRRILGKHPGKAECSIIDTAFLFPEPSKTHDQYFRLTSELIPDNWLRFCAHLNLLDYRIKSAESTGECHLQGTQGRATDERGNPVETFYTESAYHFLEAMHDNRFHYAEYVARGGEGDREKANDWQLRFAVKRLATLNRCMILALERGLGTNFDFQKSHGLLRSVEASQNKNFYRALIGTTSQSIGRVFPNGEMVEAEDYLRDLLIRKDGFTATLLVSYPNMPLEKCEIVSTLDPKLEMGFSSETTEKPVSDDDKHLFNLIRSVETVTASNNYALKIMDSIEKSESKRGVSHRLFLHPPGRSVVMTFAHPIPQTRTIPGRPAGSQPEAGSSRGLGRHGAVAGSGHAQSSRGRRGSRSHEGARGGSGDPGSSRGRGARGGRGGRGT